MYDATVVDTIENILYSWHGAGGVGNVENAREREGGGTGISRKRPLSEILRGAIRFGVDTQFINL